MDVQLMDERDDKLVYECKYIEFMFDLIALTPNIPLKRVSLEYQ